MLLHLLEPVGIAVQEVVGEIAFLLEQGGFQLLGGLEGSHVLVDQGDQERVHGPGVPEGDQAAQQGGANQGGQQQKNAGPQTEPFPHKLTGFH